MKIIGKVAVAIIPSLTLLISAGRAGADQTPVTLVSEPPINARTAQSVTPMATVASAVTPPQVFTFEQLVKAAFLQNLGLRIELALNEVEQHTESAAFRQMLPALSMNTGRSEVIQNTAEPNDETTSYSTSLSLTQPLYQPSLWANWQKAALSRDKANHELAKKQQSLLFELSRAWYLVLAETQLLEEAKASLLRLRQHQKNAQAFFESGKIWRNDVLQAHVRVARGEQAVFVATNRLALAHAGINVMLHRQITLPIELRGQLAWQSFADSLDDLLNQAMLNRLELKQSEINVESAQQDIVIAKARLKPTVNFSLSTGASSAHFGYQGSVSQTVASINLRWDLWQWGQTTREIDAAQGRLQVQRLTFSQQRQLIAEQVQRAYLSVIESQSSYRVTEQALEQAQENFKVSEIRYAEQLGSSNDVLDAQDLLTQTRNDRTSALSRYLTALAELALATGQPVNLISAK